MSAPKVEIVQSEAVVDGVREARVSVRAEYGLAFDHGLFTTHPQEVAEEAARIIAQKISEAVTEQVVEHLKSGPAVG